MVVIVDIVSAFRIVSTKSDQAHMDYDPGYFDDQTCRLEPIEDPFGPKVLPMSSE